MEFCQSRNVGTLKAISIAGREQLNFYNILLILRQIEVYRYDLNNVCSCQCHVQMLNIYRPQT